jgi:dolichol-phosphate mannosyltransferase
MKFKAYLLKAKILEIPVIFTDRSRGQSKMDGGIIQEAISGVFIMKIKSLLGTLEI